MDSHQQALSSENQQIKQSIRTEAQPNLGDVAQAASKGALIGGGIQLAFKLCEKYKQGKNPFKGDYKAEDWQEVGIDTAKGAAGAIYSLTNFASLSAPFAGSFVSASQVVASLVNDLNTGAISFEQFTEMSQLACMESAAAALASILGETLVPVPLIGAVLGTIAGRIVMDISKKYFSKGTEYLPRQIDTYYNLCLAKIDQTYHAVIEKIIAEFEKLGDLTKAAFDTSKNVALRLQASIWLATAYQVPENKTIRDTAALDTFMLS
ncbi:hypothetical protein [Lyngbya aestuarii]|uniref:hypothetical protein n=1 Tax=Lyngbya aestuarii TaxID=118322 RepID=UPI00403DAF64